MVSEVESVKGKIATLKESLKSDKTKLASWRKEHRSSLKEHKRALQQCEKEETRAQKEIEKYSKSGGTEHAHALAKEKTVRARRDSALKIVRRDESELAAFESKVKLDEAKLTLETSHLKHAKDETKRMKKELKSAEKKSKGLKDALKKKLEEWKGAGLACSIALEEYKTVVSESTKALEEHSNLGVQCVEAAGREVLYSKEYLARAPDYASRIHAEDMLELSRYHRQIASEVKRTVRSLRMASMRKKQISKESVKAHVQILETRQKEYVVVVALLTSHKKSLKSFTHTHFSPYDDTQV